MKKVLFISNIPSPYRVKFFEKLGKNVKLTVLFEAQNAQGISFDWIKNYKNFQAIFLSSGSIKEKQINFNVIKYVKKNKYDYVFATNYAYRTELLAIFLLILKKIPFFLEVDGGIKKSENLIKHKFKEFLFSKPKLIFSPSKITDDYFRSYSVSPQKIIRYSFSSLEGEDIISDVVSPEKKKEIRRKLSLPNKITILFVGQIIYRKGVDVLLKAIAKVDCDLQVIVIGETPDNGYYQSLRNLIGDNVLVKPFMSSKELKLFYQAADIFVLPTRFDIWGLVINEAMANGLPIITTNKCVAGLELVKNDENGFIVPVDDEECLAKYITQLSKDQNLRNVIGKNNLKRISEYTIENMVKQHMDILDDNHE